MIRTLKYYTSVDAVLKILKYSCFLTTNKLISANDLLEKALLEKIGANKIYGFCFLRKTESLPMWKLYANGGCLLYFALKNSVKSFDDFIVNASDKIKNDCIAYKNKKEFGALLKNPLLIKENDLYLIKRSDFNFENEYRFVFKTNTMKVDFHKCKIIKVFCSPNISLQNYKKLINFVDENKREKINIEILESNISQVYKECKK